MSIKISKVTIDDAPELLRIYAPYVKDTAISFEYEVPTLEEFERRIRNISSNLPYIKATIDGRIVGYAYANSFKERAAYDWSVETTVYVDFECRQKGIGSSLYKTLEGILKDIGILNMNACIASPISESKYLTDDSIKFHTAMGFTEVGKFHNSGYKFGKWFDMIWMEKIIGNHEGNVTEVRFGEWRI